MNSILLLLAAFFASLTISTEVSAEETSGTVLLHYSVQNPDLKAYAVGLFDIINSIKVPRQEGDDPEKIPDIVFVSKAGTIVEGRISDAALTGLHSEITVFLEKIRSISNKCIIQDVKFLDKNVVYVFHSPEPDEIDLKCFNLGVAHYFNLDTDSVANFEDAEGVLFILSEIWKD